MPPKEIERNTNSNYADRYVLRFNNLRTRFQTDGEKIFPAGSERQQCFFNKLACFENEVVPFVPYVRFEYRRATDPGESPNVRRTIDRRTMKSDAVSLNDVHRRRSEIASLTFSTLYNLGRRVTGLWQSLPIRFILRHAYIMQAPRATAGSAVAVSTVRDTISEACETISMIDRETLHDCSTSKLRDSG